MRDRARPSMGAVLAWPLRWMPIAGLAVLAACSSPAAPDVAPALRVTGHVTNTLTAPSPLTPGQRRPPSSDGNGFIVWLEPNATEAWRNHGTPLLANDHLRLVQSLPTDAPTLTHATLQRDGMTAALTADPSVQHAIRNRRIDTASLADPLAEEQWHLSERYDPRWNEAAWRTLDTANGATLAIIDSGVAADPWQPASYHPDLACGRLLPGASFIERDGRIEYTPGATEPVSPAATFHGTHVTGIAAACRDNGRGVRGVTSSATILPIRIFDEEGVATLAALLSAIEWAVGRPVSGAPMNPHPADVVSMSLGSDGNCTGEDAPLATLLADVTSEGTLLVAAAGNDGGLAPQLPASCPTVIAVGATDEVGIVAPYSVRGAHVDVFAPGGTPKRPILSTFASTTGHPTYDTLHGTSMATPWVAALLTLAKARHPHLGVGHALDLLHSASATTYAPCTPLGFDGGICASHVLDAGRFSALALQPLPEIPALLVRTVTPTLGGNVAPFDVWNAGPTPLRLDEATTPLPFVTLERFGPVVLEPGKATTFLATLDTETARTAGHAGLLDVPVTLHAEATSRTTLLWLDAGGTPSLAEHRIVMAHATPAPAAPTLEATQSNEAGAWRLDVDASLSEWSPATQRVIRAEAPTPTPLPHCHGTVRDARVLLTLPDPPPRTLTGITLPLVTRCATSMASAAATPP